MQRPKNIGRAGLSTRTRQSSTQSAPGVESVSLEGYGVNLRTSSAATAVSGCSILRVAHAKGMTPAANQAVRREHEEVVSYPPSSPPPPPPFVNVSVCAEEEDLGRGAAALAGMMMRRGRRNDDPLRGAGGRR